MAELKPCPFCGSSYVDTNAAGFHPDGYDFDFFVLCNQCGASTRAYKTINEAEIAWNRRFNNG